MKKVPIDLLEGNAVVARELKSDAGNVILAKGVSITPSMKAVLLRMGVTGIFIETDAVNAAAVDMGTHLEMLDQRCRRSECSPYLEEIRSIVTDHLNNGHSQDCRDEDV
jgi:hypothetical protein